MRRREFVSLLCGSASWPLAARAQQPAVPVIGFLRAGSTEGSEPLIAAFRQGLREAGYVEGKNVRIEFRSADGRYERLPGLAAELIRRRVNVIVASAMPSALAVKAATATIPIVFNTAADPLRYGLVRSTSRPEGNITGVTSYSGVLVTKQLELTHDLVPKAAAIALLVNPAAPVAELAERDIRTAAVALGRRVRVVRAVDERELDAAFAALAEMRPGALIVGADPFFDGRIDLIVAETARQRLPACYHLRRFVEAGGLLSYGTSEADAFRQAGIYAGRILKGAKPADLPVVHPSKFELVLNLRTAMALGLKAPESLLLRADELIE